MAFTTKEYPHKTFESMEEFDAFVKVRKDIIEQLKSKAPKKARLLKVNCVVKQDLLDQIIKWISYLQKT